MKLKRLGTACISLETENAAIIFDPYIPRKGSDTPSADEEFPDYYGDSSLRSE